MLIEKLKVWQGRIQRNFDTTDAVLAHKLWHPPPSPASNEEVSKSKIFDHSKRTLKRVVLDTSYKRYPPKISKHVTMWLKLFIQMIDFFQTFDYF